MSVMGTAAASAVAQTAHNAQSLSRSQGKSASDRAEAQAREADLFVHRLQSASQADDPDAELPDNQAPGYEQLYLQDDQGQPLSDTAHQELPTTPVQTDAGTVPYINGQGHLYQHIDIEA